MTPPLLTLYCQTQEDCQHKPPNTLWSSLTSTTDTKRPKAHTQIPMKSTITIFNSFFKKPSSKEFDLPPLASSSNVLACWALNPLVSDLYSLVCTFNKTWRVCLLATEKIHAKVKSVINIITCYIVVGDHCKSMSITQRKEKKPKEKGTQEQSKWWLTFAIYTQVI